MHSNITFLNYLIFTLASKDMAVVLEKDEAEIEVPACKKKYIQNQKSTTS